MSVPTKSTHRGVQAPCPELLAEAWRPWAELDAGLQDAELVRLADDGAAYAELALWMGVEQGMVSLALRRARERVALEDARSAERARTAEDADQAAFRAQQQLDAAAAQEQAALDKQERSERQRANRRAAQERRAAVKPVSADQEAEIVAAPATQIPDSEQEEATPMPNTDDSVEAPIWRNIWKGLSQAQRDRELLAWRAAGRGWADIAERIGTTAAAVSRMHGAAVRRRDAAASEANEELTAPEPVVPEPSEEDAAEAAVPTIAATMAALTRAAGASMAGVHETAGLPTELDPVSPSSADLIMPAESPADGETFYPVAPAHPWQVRQLWVLIEGTGHIVLASTSREYAESYLSGGDDDDVDDD